MLRAFSDNRYDYYELTQSLGFNDSGYGIKDYILPKGSIFVHDKNNSKLGSVSEGCLKICWTPDGDCYGGICGGAMMFHSVFINTDLFRIVQSSKDNDKIEKLVTLINDLENQLENAKRQLKELRTQNRNLKGETINE